MPVTYNAAVKTPRITATRDYFADGSLEILDSAGTTMIVSFGLSSSGGTISGGVWTLAFDASTVAAAAGATASKAQIKRSAANGGSAHLTGLTVGTSGADIILDSVAISAGQNVTLTSASITHP